MVLVMGMYVTAANVKWSNSRRKKIRGTEIAVQTRQSNTILGK